jgi:Transposase DDE domain
MVSGMLGAFACQLPLIASYLTTKTKPASRVKKFERWLTNEDITLATYWQPLVRRLLKRLAKNTNELVVVMDGSEVGRNCVALMVGVVYGGRTLPLAWQVRQGNKGHFSQTEHLALLEKLLEIVPKGVRVVFPGDGEFDGTHLQDRLQWEGWYYVVRTAKNSRLLSEGNWLQMTDLTPARGALNFRAGVGVSGEGYGSLLALSVWEAQHEEPLYLLSNLDSPEQAAAYYKRRFRIETFFRDTKTRGFRLNESHLEHPERLERLLIACVLGYWWLSYLGTVAQRRGEDRLIDRTTREDLSLFQLGRRYLLELLNGGRQLPTNWVALPPLFHC